VPEDSNPNAHLTFSGYFLSLLSQYFSPYDTLSPSSPEVHNDEIYFHSALEFLVLGRCSIKTLEAKTAGPTSSGKSKNAIADRFMTIP
jgi:hypothetical protein